MVESLQRQSQPQSQPPLRRPSLRQLLPYAAALLLLLALRQARVAESLNLLLYDLATQLRPAPAGSTAPITIIGIEESDLRRLGWPLDDRLLLAAVQRLDAAGVRAIGLDLYRDIGVGADRERLRQLAERHPRLVSVFSSVDGIGAIPGTPPERRAYIDLPLDPDGVVRRDLLHVRGQAAQVVSLPMRLLEVASGNDSLRRRIERGEASIARLEESSGGYTGLDNAGVQRMLPFHRPGSFPTWSLQQLLSGAVPAEQLKGRIVLIGSLAPSLRDGFRVPFSRFRRDEGPGEMPGVEIHAHRLAALLELEQGRGLGLVAAPGWVNGLLLAAGVGGGVAVGERIRSLRHSLVTAGALTLLYLLASGVVLGRGRWFDATLPLAGFGAMAAAAWTRRGAEEQRQGKQLQRLLGQTTSSAMAHELVRRSQGLLDGGHFPGRRAEVTVLFADIEHFTSVAERLEPEVLLAWLNRGMALMVASVHHHGGLVNKFTGDGLLAVFGAPLSQGAASDATAAVRAAGGMRQALRTLNSELEQQGLPPIHLRLGLDSGWVIAGSVGSEERWEFGVIGDAVNCAARIESFDKTPIDDHCRVMMSDTTRHLVGDGVQGVWKPWGRAVLAGRSAALDIWELLDGAGPATSGKVSQCTDSRAGS